jgi:starch-binding outer membrane protein, SusD/RagB family
MKNILYKIFGVALAFLLIPSCSDNLDLDPISATSTNQFYKTDSDILGAVIAIYDGLQNIPLREFALTEMRSDNATSALHEGEWKQLETFDVQTSNSVVANYWSVNYNVIFRANTVLKYADVVIDPSAKAQYIAEAKFARAMAHFNLVRAFGDVPSVDKVIELKEADYFSRKPIASVYAFIQTDLIDAIADLKEKSGITFGRATKQAAQGLLAKVYLTQKNYTAALPILTTLVTNSQYSLMPNYKDVFYTEANNEIMFAIPYLNDSNTESQDFSYEMTVGTASGLDWVSSNFTAFSNNDLDLRKAININPSKPSQNAKFLRNSTAARLNGNDWIVLRFSDVYLMYVEAIIGTGTSTSNSEAIKYYDKVRNRAFVIPVVSTTITKQMLLDQRRAEFGFENQRLYDLIRLGDAVSVLSAYSPTFSGINDLLLPIPQTEINVSNGLLTQNPGYSN